MATAKAETAMETGCNRGKDELESSNQQLGGGFKHLLFSPQNLGKLPVLTHIFHMG